MIIPKVAVPRVGHLWFDFLVLVAGLGVVVAALVLVEFGCWVDWFVFAGLAAVASCCCTCS